nr:ATP-binding protein [uncultured Blautia sp.]
MTLAQMREGYSRPGNRAIANAFTYMKVIEQWGSGVPKMLKASREFGVREPEFLESGMDFRVILYRESVDFINHSRIMESSPVYGTEKQNPKGITTWPAVNNTAQTVENTIQSVCDPTQTMQNTTQNGGDTTQIPTVCMSDYDKQILQAVKNNPFISQRELARELRWNVDRVKYYMKKWKDKGGLRHVGSSHKGYWEVLIPME